MLKEPPIWVKLIILVVILLATPVFAETPEVANTNYPYLRATNTITYDSITLAVRIDPVASKSIPEPSESIAKHFKNLEHGELLKCIAWYESNYNPLAMGDHRGTCGQEYCAFGIVQFWKGTFKEYCTDKYGLNDIWNPYHQIVCANLMLTGNWNLISKWPTHKKCL